VKIPAGLRELMSTFPFEGRVVWIGVRPATRQPMQVLERIEAIAGRGLAGDRTSEKSRPGNSRQVTLIQAEHLAIVGSLLRRDAIDPAFTRRNIVIAGVNLLSLKGHTFRLGDAVLEMTGECHPCSLMETFLGTGGYNAMRGHGGINARVIAGGSIAIGDTLSAIPAIAATAETHDA
jgi:MOSC domain-containing protein YiiM